MSRSRFESRFLCLSVAVKATDIYIENRRFVEVVLKSHKRFEALRDFTVEGALAELDRMTMEKKDAGELTGVGSPRNASIDSARSPVSARSTSLGDVPEHGAFAIGDDEDDEDESVAESNHGISTPMSASSAAVDDAVPMQTRSMSEKARGKQPVGQSHFSRTNSQNTSTTSLTALNTLQFSTSQPFIPTQSWVRYLHVPN